MNNSKPNIIVVFHSSNIYSGATRSLTDILITLIDTKKYNFKMIFPSEEGSAIDFYKCKGIPVYSYQYGRLMQGMDQPLWHRLIKLPLLLYRYIRIRMESTKAANYFKSCNIDIVYSNTSSIVFGGYLGKKLNAKQIWHIREFRNLDHRIEFFLGDVWLKKFINSCADKVLFVSKTVMNEHKDTIEESKMAVTYNSYSVDFINPKTYFNRENGLNVLLAGDIKPSKGQFETIEAIMLANSKIDKVFKLYIAGKVSDKNYYNQLIKYINEYSLNDCVTFCGHVENMNELRNRMDIGIVSSKNEAFGRTMIEGMLSMLAMIGRNSGGTSEQIEDENTGLFYDGSSGDLAHKLLIYYNDREFMSKCAINGFNECVELHTQGRCQKIVENCLDNLIGGFNEYK